MRVGIIGAGMAGLACARRLAEADFEVQLFDKGKRPGGRLSTLTIDDMAWDYGAQYIKARGPDFTAQAAEWQRAGVLAPWPGGPAGALVGVPGMASLIEAECAGLAVRFGAQVQRLGHDKDGWSVIGPELAEGPFAALVLAIPAEQAAPLLSLHDLHLAREAATSMSRPCWSVMTAFAEPLEGVGDVLRHGGAIAWAARNNSKPGRGSSECWVIQADADWSRRNLELGNDEVAAALMAAFAELAGRSLPQITFLKAHRWRFALSQGFSPAPLWNPALQLGACGDWCGAAHVEAAWSAGIALANRIVAEKRALSEAGVERVAGIEPA